MATSILLIGAGGWLGAYLVKEFIHRKDKFSRVAILASDESKTLRFAEAEKNGIDVIVGSFLDVDSYKGKTPAEMFASYMPATICRAAKILC